MISPSQVLDYINTISSQRELNKQFPKLTSFSFYQPEDYKTISSVIDLVKSSSYFYTGIISLDLNIYTNKTEKTYYYEFVFPNRKLERYKYLYIPQNYFEDIKDKLPFLKSFKIINNVVTQELIYPTHINLLETVNFSVFSTYETERGKHPFLPYMLSTGKVLVIFTGNIYIYEDIEGYFGPKGYEYYSWIKPLDISIPSLENYVTCREDLIEEGPYKQEYIDIPKVLKYQGKLADNDYGDTQYYLYKDEEEKEHLLEEYPIEGANNLVKNLAYESGKDLKIINKEIDNNQQVQLNQQGLEGRIRLL